MPQAATSRLQDEQEIVRLLDALHALPVEHVPARHGHEQKLLALVDRHFREALKPYLLSKFGRVAGVNGVAQYTAMMHDFFVKVLDKRPDEFWRAKSATELRKWASVVVSNQMKDYLNRQKRYQHVEDGLGALVEERQRFFKAKTGIELSAEVLDVVDEWCQSQERKALGWTLRHRFVDGMTREQIADQLNVSVNTVRTTLARGIEELRSVFPSD